jgi:hypothetical protein
MNRAALATAQSETAITSDDWRQKTPGLDQWKLAAADGIAHHQAIE